MDRFYVKTALGQRGAPLLGWVIDRRTGRPRTYQFGASCARVLQLQCAHLNAEHCARQGSSARQWRALAFGALLCLALLLAACGAPLRPGEGARVVFTSADGIAMQPPGGAVHFYRYKRRQ